MFSRIAALSAALLLSPQVVADDSDQLCTAGGYYAGAQDHFLSGLAVHILEKRGVLGNTKCGALWRAAYDVGDRLSRTGKSKPEDSTIINDVTAFSARVYSSIAKGAGY